MANVIINDINLSNIAAAIRGKNGSSNTYKVSEMASAINNLPTGGGDMEPIVISGSKNYWNYEGNWDSFIDNNRGMISSNGLTGFEYGFYGSKLKEIPFELNFNVTSSGGIHYCFEGSKLEVMPVIKGKISSQMRSAFSNMDNLKKIGFRDDLTAYGEGYMIQSLFDYNRGVEEIEGKLPAVVGGYDKTIANIGYVFRDCGKLRTISEDFFANLPTQPSGTLTNNGLGSAMFQRCSSLRKLPSIKNLNRIVQVTYNSMCDSCYVLDEIRDIGVYTYSAMTSNRFASAFSNCYRLKAVTFETNEDGSPIVAQWKSQTIDLSTYVGYATVNSKSTILKCGITADKEVTDGGYNGTNGTYDAYEALKDDPDWFTCDQNFSRYNLDSAIETINSLPDCSAYGTNTIKFNQYAGTHTSAVASGANLHKGAIGNLTTEQIAVAAAKGWTVTLV